MPILSFYEGLSELSFVLSDQSNNSSEDISSFVFPYTYLPNLFSNSFTKEKFYKDVFKRAFKHFKTTQKACDIYTVGVLTEPTVPFKVKKSAVVMTNLPKGYIYTNFDMFATYQCMSSFEPIASLESDDDVGANLSLYSMVHHLDPSDVIAKDGLLRRMANTCEPQVAPATSSNRIILTGERFTTFDLIPAFSLLLSYDLIRSPGVFRVAIDKGNLFPHSLLLSGLAPIITELGTLVNSPGKTECLYHPPAGDAQLFDLDENKIFIIPLEKGDVARLFIKTPEGQLDRQVYGGDLGVVIDTRDKSNPISYSELYLDTINRGLSKL